MVFLPQIFLYRLPPVLSLQASHHGTSRPTCRHNHTCSNRSRERERERDAFALTPMYKRVKPANLSTSATNEAVEEITQPVGIPPINRQLKQIVALPQHLQFEDELKSHTDPTWVQELITGITKGVSLGYHRQRCQHIFRNLISDFKNIRKS